MSYLEAQVLTLSGEEVGMITFVGLVALILSRVKVAMI
jgi:hypothetical protein